MKKMTFVMTAILFLATCTGCTAEERKPKQLESVGQIETTETTESATELEEKSWKTTYAQLVEEFEREYEETKYSLIYLDADVIPELFLEAGVEHGCVYTYKEDAASTVWEWGFWRERAFSRYEPHSGIYYLYSNGGAGCYSYEAWQLTGTETAPLDTYASSILMQEDGVFEERFTCNEELINKEDFEAEMDRLETVTRKPTILSYEEIMELLA